MLRRRVSIVASSIPSAVIGRLRLSPSPTIAPTIAALSALSPIDVMKLRSILIRSNGSARRCARLE